MPNPFKRGDIVRLKTGRQPIIVTHSCSWAIDGYYLSSSCLHAGDRRYQDYVHFDGEFTDENHQNWGTIRDYYAETFLGSFPEITLNGETTMKTLYETEDGRFGTKLATNSEGKSVLEMKGENGKVEAFDPKTLTEVVPYTVALQYIEGPQQYGRTKNYHYISTKGAVSKGDIVFVEGSENMARVTAVNTKSKQATTELKGRKVKTTKI